MKLPARRLLAVSALLAAVCIAALWLLPIPTVSDATPLDQLAGPDGRFLDVGDRRLYIETAGDGDPLILLLHGFGASLFTWRDVLPSLSDLGTVVAYDRTGFGLSDRPMPGDWEGESPYSASYQADLAADLVEALGASEAVLIGNSAGGRVAMQTALEHPEQVRALVLVSPAVLTTGGLPDWAKPILRLPPVRRIGPLLVRRIATEGAALIEQAWHDPARITPDRFAGYKLPLQAKDWDRALWEVTLAPSAPSVVERLDDLDIPVLILTGDDDRVVPTAETLRLASLMPEAELVVLPHCGHLPQEECPEAFLEAVGAFLKSLP